MREVTSLIDILFSFTSIVTFPFFSFWWLRERICFECVSYFPTSWCTLWPWRLFFLMLVLMRVLPFRLVSLLLTRFLLPIFTMGCHKRWFLFCLLVSLWTHFLVCVCGNDMSCTLYLIFIKTMLMSNAHPYHKSSQVLFHDSHTLLWLSQFLSCFFYMLLNHLFCAIDMLIVSSIFLHSLCVFINFGGATILFCARVSNTKISY